MDETTIRTETPTIDGRSVDGPGNSRPFALGIDVGKDTLEVALLTPHERLHTKSVRNTEAGFRALVRWLSRLTDDSTSVRVCLEASGGYEEDVALFLSEQGLSVSLVNPRQTSAYAASQMRRSKTDRADAALLARFCQRERPPAWRPPSLAERQLRELTRGLEALKRERDRTKNRRDRAGHDAVASALEELIRALSKQIQALEAEIEAHLAAHPDLGRQRDLLVSIPGVGPLTAALVLAELGDISRFESARQAAAYAGLVPRHHESGTSVRRRTRLSKLGNSRLRRALYFPALSAMRHNEAVEVFATRLRAKGKAKMAVVGASMRKLLHICFGVLKNGTPFDASLHPAS